MGARSLEVAGKFNRPTVSNWHTCVAWALVNDYNRLRAASQEKEE